MEEPCNTNTSTTIICGFRARLYPTTEVEIRLNQWAGALRFLWNRLLDLEKAEYDATGNFIWRKELRVLALALKRAPETAWLNDLPAHAVLDTVIRMDAALRRMVKFHKQGRKCGFPRPKKKFTREAGIYCAGQTASFDTKSVKLPKIKTVKMRGGSLPQGRLLSARIFRDGEHWMVAGQFECGRPKPLASNSKTIGIDLGISTLVTGFDGNNFLEIAAPRKLRKAQSKLRRAQRKFSRRKKGSARRCAQARVVHNIYRKVHEQRLNALHQISHRLTAKADVLKFETLNVVIMSKNKKIAFSVADAGMSHLVTLCEYKANWRGRAIEKIDRWFPSTQLCSACGEKNAAMKHFSRRIFYCSSCGYTEGRDRNAARNIYWYRQEGENCSRNRTTHVDKRVS
jgi:putative transposase